MSYWDDYQPTTTPSPHPGEGLILPVDAHPDQSIRRPDGLPWLARIQAYDSTFGLEWTAALICTSTGSRRFTRRSPAPVFWRVSTPVLSSGRGQPGRLVAVGWRGLPPTGTQIRVESVSADKFTMRVHVVRRTTGAARRWVVLLFIYFKLVHSLRARWPGGDE